ncbi:hypothetical protein DFJ74DRAFT_26235 [Hyaloraphidium curvatum]|nr:hypothetical protein DFJ74DRAFT_26235 [Hyaloraphidium curvatum]
MPPPRPSPHPAFVSELAKDAPVPSFSFSELATGFYDVLQPLVPSPAARLFVLHHVANMALVCIGLRQACFVWFGEGFPDDRAAQLGEAAAGAFCSLRANGVPGTGNIGITINRDQSNSFVLYRLERVHVTDVLAAARVLGAVTDLPTRDLWLPAARALGYPIFTVHPETIPAKDQWRLQCAIIVEELATGALRRLALYHARYGEKDVERAKNEIERHADALNNAIAGEEIAEFRIRKALVVSQNWEEIAAEQKIYEEGVKGIVRSGGGWGELLDDISFRRKAAGARREAPVPRARVSGLSRSSSATDYEDEGR